MWQSKCAMIQEVVTVFHICSTYEPSGSSGQNLQWFLKHEVDGILVHCRVTPSIKFTSTNLYTWVERNTVKVKCLAQENDTMP